MLTRIAVLKMAPGASGVAKPAEGQSLADFQTLVDLLSDLEAEGEITITHSHQAAETGLRYVDVVMFRRHDYG